MTGGFISLDFEVRGAYGRVDVRVSSNDAPEEIGSDAAASGFPVCEATVESPLRGYAALMGWVQMVGTSAARGATRRFEPDPLRIFDDLDLPFGFHGVAPTLFDAPYRRDRSHDLDWLAHSFLCASAGDPMERSVRPLAAFQWGFVLESGDVRIVPPTPLPLIEWTTHRPLLTAAYPSWVF